MDSFPQADKTRREYRMDWWKRILFLSIGATLILAWFLPVGRGNFYERLGVPGQFIGLTLSLIGTSIIGRAIPSRLVIDGPRIEVRNFLRLRIAALSEIEGYFEDNPGLGKRVVLRLKNARGNVRIPQSFNIDDDFHRWIEQLPDLNDKNYHERTVALAAEGLGATFEEQERTLKRASTQRALLFLTTAASAFGLWQATWPLQAVFALFLVVAPWIGWFWLKRSPTVFAFNKPKQDPRIDLFYSIWIGCVLFLHAFYLFKPSSSPGLLWIALPLGAIYTACFFPFLPRSASLAGRVWNPIWLFLFMACPYTMGMAIVANSVADRAPAVTFAVRVKAAQVTRDSGRFRVELGKERPASGPEFIKVDSDMSQEITARGRVCILLHPGLLHIPWYEVVHCPVLSATR
ncbi:MAG: hypothetical protein ABSD72_11610 [Terracidiphilus sp.]|jgi:hypothetical protein